MSLQDNINKIGSLTQDIQVKLDALKAFKDITEKSEYEPMKGLLSLLCPQIDGIKTANDELKNIYSDMVKLIGIQKGE